MQRGVCNVCKDDSNRLTKPEVQRQDAAISEDKDLSELMSLLTVMYCD
jgi:hypothetical protein